MRYRDRRKKLMSDINVVPYIDVMLVLLVIFMLTAPLLEQNIKIALPKARSQPVGTRRAETLVVTVDRQGKYHLDNKLITTAALAQKVSTALKAQPKTNVLVRGDRDASYGEVVKLMSLLQSAGVPNVGLLTEPPRDR